MGDGAAEIEVRPVLPGTPEMAALYDLRLRVLRPGREPETVRFPEDARPDALHLGAFSGGRLVGIASLYSVRGIHLRGMAVEPDARGMGAGAAIVREAQRIATARRLDLWCNARDSANGFYAKLGFITEGDGFQDPNVGPHHVMRWTGG